MSPSEKTVQVSDLIVVLGESQIQGTVKVTIASKRPLIDAKKKEGLGSKIKNLFSKPKE